MQVKNKMNNNNEMALLRLFDFNQSRKSKVLHLVLLIVLSIGVFINMPHCFAAESDTSPISYTINYELNGGTMEQSSLQTVEEGETVWYPIPNKKGYEFKGWYMNSDFSGVAVTRNISDQTQSFTVYAYFVPLTYSITYDLKGGTLLSKQPAAYVYGNSFVFSKVVRKGYTFMGWVTDETSQPCSAITSDMIGDVAVHATWKKVSVSKMKSPKLSCKQSKVRVTFTAVKSVLGYEVTYWQKGKDSSKKSRLCLKNGITVSGLKKKCKYAFKIRAYKADSDGQYVYGKYSNTKYITVK